MKIKILVAFIATATIIFTSCNWFQSKKKQSVNPLVGEWRLDSISIGKDTSIAYAIIAMAAQDSSDVNVTFTTDTIFSSSQTQVDTIQYSFDEKVNQLITKDSSLQTMSFSRLNDSLISLTTKDSAIVFLRKK
jgi:hypothetical protein